MPLNLKNKRALITGGAGAIGINLVRRLVQEGTAVTVFSLPARDLVRLKDLERKVEIITGDITNAAQVNGVVARVKPHFVFHLASTTMSVPLAKHIEVNELGTLYLLEALKGLPVERFVYTGTAAVYGSGNKVKESAPFTPDSVFGAAKAATSVLVQTYARVHAVPTVELRFFLPYGPWEHPGRLVPHIILSALDKKDLPLTAGKQERDPTYIDDVVDAFLLAANKPVPRGSIFNIASGKPVTVRKMVETVLALMGNPIAPRFGAVPTRDNEIMKMSADTNAARRVLGWKPKHTLKTGLQKTIAWWKQNREFAAYMTEK